MNTLSEQLSELINPLPTLVDPEDDIHIETSAKEIFKTTVNEKESKNVDEYDISVLRRKKVQNLSHINQRYSGKKINRKVLEDLSDSSDGKQEMGSDSDNSENVEFYSDYLKAPMASDEELDHNESDVESSGVSVGNESEDYVNQFSAIDVNDEIAKGLALKNQILIWDNLLECRIRLQKVLIDFNKFPQFDSLSQMKKSNDNQLNYCLKETTKTVKTLFNNLIEIESTLDSQNDLLSNNSDQQIQDISGEEEKTLSANTSSKSGLKRKLSEAKYSEFLSKKYCDLTEMRKNIINKWYEKTRFTSSTFKLKYLNGLEQSSNQQIDHILSDMQRLINRTQTKRSLYSIIGKTDINDKTIDTNESNDEIINKNSVQIDDKELDPEIFDDDDFYQHLLRELIESKGVNDSNVLSRKWIEIQKLRNKMKRKVDTKASKGRKIRYDVHSKLVNFMAPIDCSTYTEEAKDELFGSLFGKQYD